MPGEVGYISISQFWRDTQRRRVQPSDSVHKSSFYRTFLATSNNNDFQTDNSNLSHLTHMMTQISNVLIQGKIALVSLIPVVDWHCFCDAGSLAVDQILMVLLSTSMFVGGLSGFILDNTIPGQFASIPLKNSVSCSSPDVVFYNGTPTCRNVNSSLLLQHANPDFLTFFATILSFGRQHKPFQFSVPGSERERGLLKWREQVLKQAKDEDAAAEESGGLRRNPLALYEIPFLTYQLKRWSWTRYVPFLPTFVEKKKQNKKKRKRGDNIEENTV